MGLGDAFPKDMVSASVKRQMVPGTVIKVRETMDDGNAKEKRFIVLHVAEDTFTCVINSELTRLQQKNSELFQCQVVMPQSSHTFMSWDSYIDCSRVRRYRTDEVCDQLEANPSLILGTITASLRDGISSALKYSRTAPPAEVIICVESLALADLRS